MFKHLAALGALFALYLVSRASVAEAPMEIGIALAALDQRRDCRWSALTEQSGALSRVSRFSGRTDGRETWVCDLDTGTETTFPASPAKGRLPDAAGAARRPLSGGGCELSIGRNPVREISRLTENLRSFRSSGDGLFVGQLSPLDATAIHASLARRESSSSRFPPAAVAQGLLEIWVENHRIEKYRVTTSGPVSVAFGRKEQKIVTTVWLDEGAPASARGEEGQNRVIPGQGVVIGR